MPGDFQRADFIDVAGLRKWFPENLSQSGGQITVWKASKRLEMWERTLPHLEFEPITGYEWI
jgi:hypothetical protein